jgi:hypothetical protein
MSSIKRTPYYSQCRAKPRTRPITFRFSPPMSALLRTVTSASLALSAILLVPTYTYAAEGAQASVPKAAFVAGLSPWQRPAAAPVLTTTPHEAIKTSGLHGIAQPIPPSLSFLDHQGAWYTPFNRAGMTGPYDLRGWHHTSPSTARESK